MTGFVLSYVKQSKCLPPCSSAKHKQNETFNLWLLQLGDLGELWEIWSICVRHSCQWECGFQGLLISAMRSEEYTL